MYSNETGEDSSIGVKIRRNSTVSSPSEKEKVYENQQSDYKSRRWVIEFEFFLMFLLCGSWICAQIIFNSDGFLIFCIHRYSEKVLNRRNASETKLEYTTEQIRQELAEKEALLKSNELKSDSNETEASQNTTSEATTIAEEPPHEHFDVDKVQDTSIVQNDEISANTDQKSNTKDSSEPRAETNDEQQATAGTKEPTESKSKKKRRKKSMMKKKASLTTTSVSASSLNMNSSASRKNSSSSSAGSASIIPSDQMDFDTDPNQPSSNATSLSIDDLAKSETAVTANDSFTEPNNVHQETMDTPRMCDFHFFSDTEVAASPYGSRPSTPIQSDSEFEISQREKNSDPMTSSTASWKWGEFPITPIKTDADSVGSKDAKQAERNSTLNTMLSFMKETMRMRKSTSDGGVYLSDLMNTEGLDPDVVAKYFPPPKNASDLNLNDGDDHESGNGTSLPHSPSSVENGVSKSIAFDFDHDGKLYEK